MKSRDFAYWLMGCFELNEISSITAKQFKLISKHLDLVFKYEKTKDKAYEFCLWLKGCLDISKEAFTIEQTLIIKNKLNEVFIHEIDHSFGSKKEVLEKIHNPVTPFIPLEYTGNTVGYDGRFMC